MNIRNLATKDIPYMLEWMHDSDINVHFQFDAANATEASAQEFINNSMTEKSINYAVIDEDDNYMGTISLKNIDKVNKQAEYAISFRSCAMGKGYSKYATEEILKIAFEELALHKVYLNVLSDNIRANKFYEKFGFIYEGEFKEHINIRGVFKDLKWYRILKSEWVDKND